MFLILLATFLLLAAFLLLPALAAAAPIRKPLSEESPYIQAAPAYDVEEARRYIPVLPAIRDLADRIPEDDSLTMLGQSSPSAESLTLLDREIRRLSMDHHQVSLIMADLKTQTMLSYRSAVPMCSQSTIKAIYVGAVIESMPESLAENGQWMHDAIVYSDNESYELLRQRYGKGPILKWCLEAGVDPAFADPLYPRDRTAREMFKMWTRLYVFLNHDTTGFAAYYADSLASATRLQLKLPLQSKAGWEHGLPEERLFDPAEIPLQYRDGNPLNDECAINDTGVVYTDRGPYLFVIYTDHPYVAVEGCPHPLLNIVKLLYNVQQSIRS